MMDVSKPLATALPEPETSSRENEAAPPAGAAVPEAVVKFNSCRWRCTPDQGGYCTHRDVLPFAGKEGFTADSWCPECSFYKLRRTPKKRERLDFSY